MRLCEAVCVSSPGRCCVLSTTLLWTLVIPGAALGRGVRQSACVCVCKCCVCPLRGRAWLPCSGISRTCENSYSASKLELYILYLTFKAPISKITIGFIKNIHLIIFCICLKWTTTDTVSEALPHYFEKLRLGWFLWFWDLEGGKTKEYKINWSGWAGSKTTYHTSPFAFPKAKTGTGLCGQRPYCDEGDHLKGCRLSPWVVVCQYPHSTKRGCC